LPQTRFLGAEYQTLSYLRIKEWREKIGGGGKEGEKKRSDGEKKKNGESVGRKRK